MILMLIKNSKLIGPLIAALLLCVGIPLALTADHPTYDLNADGTVDYEDSFIVWNSRGTYDILMDFNDDGFIDYEDALEVWLNRGDPGGDTILDWLTELIWS